MFGKFNRLIDKFFEQLKYATSVVSFVFISLSILFFVYWLIYSANIGLPDWFNLFIWSVIDFLARDIKDTNFYDEVKQILPVFASGVFVLATYFANCFMVFIESNHKHFDESVENYKRKLAKTINEELHSDYINTLKKTSYMLIKLRITAIKQESYIDTSNETDIDTEKVISEIYSAMLSALNDYNVKQKGLAENSLYFLLSDFTHSKEFLTSLVSTATENIKLQLRPKLDISFYCAVHLFDTLSELTEAQNYLNKILNTKIKNKIVVTPKVKLYFDELAPSLFQFDVVGEYSLNDDCSDSKVVKLYSLKRK